MTHPLRALLIILAIAAIANRAAPQSVVSARAALADRQSFPQEDRPYLYYLDISPSVGQEREDLKTATDFMICSTSLEPIIEYTKPFELPGTNLLRIDTRQLGWNHDSWRQVLSHYPYFPGGVTAVVRADWLLVELADMQDSQSGAYMRLMYGDVETRDEILQILGVSNQRQHVFGLIEGESQVAKQNTRWIENRPVLRGYAWGTRDSLQLTVDKDPLENPDGSQLHDGEEWIIGIPKQSITSGARGTLQVYFLANGNGQLVNRAPVDLVEDSTTFRGYREIRTPGSCIQCHKTGLNSPTTNAFRDLVNSGVTPFTNDPNRAVALQSFHLSDVTKEINRGNDDYQTIVTLITGKPSADVSVAFQRAVDRYDAPLDMLSASEEFTRHGYQVQDVVAALEVAANTGRAGARLSGLARNQKITREAFEQQYLDALNLIQQWSESQ